MRTKLENRLCKRLTAFLPGHVVRCEFGADGVVAVAIEKPETAESWWITGIAIQSLVGKEAFAETVEQLLFEIRALSGETPSQGLALWKRLQTN